MPIQHNESRRFEDDGENLRLASSVKSPSHLSPQRKVAHDKLMGIVQSGDHVNPKYVYNYLESHGA